jgi:hypothetical protein
MDKRFRLLSVLILISFFLIFQIPGEAATPTAQSSLTAKALEKVEPIVAEELETRQQTAFFIWLSEKADLSPAYDLDTKLEKGQFVYETLLLPSARSRAAQLLG